MTDVTGIKGTRVYCIVLFGEKLRTILFDSHRNEHNLPTYYYLYYYQSKKYYTYEKIFITTRQINIRARVYTHPHG